MNETTQQSDQFLLNSLQDGEEKAFDFIFRKYYKALCAQANLYVHDLDQAQNLVQDCFIKMWENRKNAGQIKNLSAYLSFMVRNRSIDHVRKSKKEIITELVSEGVEMTDSSDEIFISYEFEEKLVEALSMLPERCRVAFEYSRFEGLTYNEIAQKMNVTVKAVEALMSRSLRILRVELKEYLPLLLMFLRL
jgi:RNA polymerase sigma-70 factor (ECF subfamily)